MTSRRYILGPLLLVGLGVVALAPGRIRAQVPPPAETFKEAQARQHFERAETHYRLGAFKEALDEYQAALKQVRRPSIIFNIAQCHRQLGQDREALFFYRLYLSDWERQNPGKPPRFHDEVKGHIQVLEARARTSSGSDPPSSPATARDGSLRIEGLPDGARVFLDGLLVAQAPLRVPLRLSPGSHRLEVAAAGFAPFARDIQIEAGQEQPLPVELVPERRRRPLWLGLGIAAAVLALCSEGTAIAYTIKANDTVRTDPAFDTYRGVAIGGHVGAGVMAAASAASFILYALSDSRTDASARAGLGLVPSTEGVMVVGEVPF